MSDAINALFLKNAEGDLCIAFDDPLYVRAQAVFIDPGSREVTGLIDGVTVAFGKVSARLAGSFIERKHILLTAPHPDGFDIAINTQLRTLH